MSLFRKDLKVELLRCFEDLEKSAQRLPHNWLGATDKEVIQIEKDDMEVVQLVDALFKRKEISANTRAAIEMFAVHAIEVIERLEHARIYLNRGEKAYNDLKQIIEVLETALKAYFDDNLSAIVSEVQKDPYLHQLFNRQLDVKNFDNRLIREALRSHGYPPRSTKFMAKVSPYWRKPLNPKFCKGKYIYLLRGDEVNLKTRGIYTTVYGFRKLTVDLLVEKLPSSAYVSYLLYGFIVKPNSISITDELIRWQRARGFSAFISATISIKCAEAGSGKGTRDASHPNSIYVIRVPRNIVARSPSEIAVEEEEEYFIPDFVMPSEILAEFRRENTEEVFEFLRRYLPVTREDVCLT